MQQQTASMAVFEDLAAEGVLWAGVAMLVLAVLLCAQVPLWGIGPRWTKKAWTLIIRCFKRGDKRTWNWSEVEPGLYVGSLPRVPDDLGELQVAPHNLGAVVSLVEAWEMKVSESDLERMDITWLHLPTPDYSAPTVGDIERAAIFIDRQVRFRCPVVCVARVALGEVNRAVPAQS